MSKIVMEMFRSIAPGYDRANDILSLGIHRLWRRKVVRLARIGSGDRALDLCCGTGDLSFLLADSGAQVIGLDFVNEMLNLAEQKQAASQNTKAVRFIRGDALSLPFPEKFFDVATIAFGIRNVDDTVLCLEEIQRVLKPNGRLFVLEFGQPTIPGFREFYQLYSRHVMPRIGGLITGNRSAYEYLPNTARAYPAGPAFLELMQKAGYQDVSASPLCGGIAYLYSGTCESGTSKIQVPQELTASVASSTAHLAAGTL